MSDSAMVRLPALKAGDLVALEASAGCVEVERVEGAVRLIESRGFRVSVSRDLTRRDRYFAGTDTERLAGLQTALDDPEVKAVFMVRGGYGSQRIAPLLSKPASGPKAVAGFSDNTALLGYLGRNFGWPTLHGPHPRFDHPGEFDELLSCLMEGAKPVFEGLRCISEGETVVAPVSGGCLSILSATVSTSCFPDLKGRIVFLEDTCEAPYRVDRMLAHLYWSGVLEHAAAIVFGVTGTFGTAETGEGEIDAVIEDFASRCTVPVLTGLPCGHGDTNRPLPFGPRARLDAAWGTLKFLEPAAG